MSAAYTRVFTVNNKSGGVKSNKQTAMQSIQILFHYMYIIKLTSNKMLIFSVVMTPLSS